MPKVYCPICSEVLKNKKFIQRHLKQHETVTLNKQFDKKLENKNSKRKADSFQINNHTSKVCKSTTLASVQSNQEPRRPDGASINWEQERQEPDDTSLSWEQEKPERNTEKGSTSYSSESYQDLHQATNVVEEDIGSQSYYYRKLESLKKTETPIYMDLKSNQAVDSLDTLTKNSIDLKTLCSSKTV
jgi:hypothetical protein